MRILGPHGCALAALVALFGLETGGCAASNGPYAEPSATAERGLIDPWEGTNRKVFAFNEALDIHALQPVAREWDRLIPDQGQKMLTNFRSNLRYPVVLINDLFQANVKAAAVETGRFLVNTTLGFGGFFDPATTWALPGCDEDFGLTLGHWGVDTGPYLVIPVLGPSTARDLSGGIVDAGLGVVSTLAVAWYITAPLRTVQLINPSTSHLNIVDDNRQTAFDYYSFVRDAYLRHRETQAREGGAQVGSGNDIYYPDTEEDSP